jgi:hypothetical protein
MFRSRDLASVPTADLDAGIGRDSALGASGA